MIGKEGSGRLRAVAAQQRQKLSAKAQKKFALKSYGSSGGASTAGHYSSLALTPIQARAGAPPRALWVGGGVGGARGAAAAPAAHPPARPPRR